MALMFESKVGAGGSPVNYFKRLWLLRFTDWTSVYHLCKSNFLYTQINNGTKENRILLVASVCRYVIVFSQQDWPPAILLKAPQN